MTGSQLTAFQERVEAGSYDDFTVGYPRTALASDQLRRFVELLSTSSSRNIPGDIHAALESVKEKARLTLSVPDSFQCAVTFSGSIALDKTISALVPKDRNTLITEPGFDSIASFVERSAQRKALVIRIDPFAPREQRIREIISRIDKSVGAVVIVSPDNPSGLAWSPVELSQLGWACGQVDAVLIVDHCFAMINPGDIDLGMAFNLNDACRWVALWDTSKTIELGGEKLGFIFASQPELEIISTLINEIQLDLPYISLIAMGSAMEDLRDKDELGALNRLIRDNYFKLRAACGAAGLKINAPDAGGFSLIAINKEGGWGSLSLAARLMDDYGIALVPSQFMHFSSRAPDNEFLRVSLARPRDKIDRLCGALQQATVITKHHH